MNSTPQSVLSDNQVPRLLQAAGKILAVAAVYFLVARLSLLLAIPPGYSTPVWPASGVALAALLLYGCRLWPGVLLGSFLANVFTSYDASSTATIIHSLTLAASIGMGAALQALLGVFMIRRFIDLESGLVHGKSVFGFLLLGGPVSCLFNATWGVASLGLFGVISRSEAAYSWMTWWVGDVIGVIVVLPLAFIWLGRPRAIWRNRKRSVALPLLFLLSFVITLFVIARNHEQQRVEEDFSRHAVIVADALHKNLTSYLNILHFINRFYVTTDEIDPQAFKIFVAHALEQFPEIHALSWNPRIFNEKRAEFEQAKREQGFSDFVITERDAQGNLVPAATRPTYVTVAYIEPHERNASALGFDVYSTPSRRLALDKARDSGAAVATERITLVQEQGAQSGILVFLPIYSDASGEIPSTLDERREKLLGYAVGVFRMGDLLRIALKGIAPLNTQISLLDDSTTGAEQSLARYLFDETGSGRRFSSDESAAAQSSLEWSRAFHFGSRDWRLLLRATPQYIADTQSWLAWGVLVVGLALTSLLGGFLLMLTGRSYLDGLRADELAHSNRLLNEEISEHEQAQQELNRHKQHLEEMVEEQTADLLEAKELAESANKAKSLFLANMSHELRTPLNAILGFSRILHEDEELPEKALEQIAIINRSGEHLLAMINDVLDLSKIEAGRAALEINSFDLPQLVEEIGEMFAARAQQEGLEFRLERSAALLPYIKSDASKLRQILINLLGNAVKFTPVGRVTLRAATTPIEGSPDCFTLQLEIEDSGPGIAPEEQERIFEPFTQLPGSNETTKGTGLGLAITHSFTILLGGTIRIESQLGKGTLFHVDIPVAQGDAEEAGAITTVRPKVVGLVEGQTAWRILVVDDNSVNRQLLSALLSKVGFDIREATDGQEAVEQYRQWHPHFIWMDMNMPVMDGYEATSRIRDLPGGDEVKIVSITATAFQEQRSRIIDVGCDDVVIKPYKPHQIYDVMEKFLDVRYVYKEQHEKVLATTQKVSLLTPEEISILPAELLVALDEAAYALDVQQAKRILDKISETRPEAAKSMRRLVENFDFLTLKKLLASARS